MADAELVGRWAATVQPTTASAITELGDIRYLATPLVAEGSVAATFVVVYFPADDRDEIDAVLRLEAMVGLAVFAVAAVLAWDRRRPGRATGPSAHRDGSQYHGNRSVGPPADPGSR